MPRSAHRPGQSVRVANVVKVNSPAVFVGDLGRVVGQINRGIEHEEPDCAVVPSAHDVRQEAAPLLSVSLAAARATLFRRGPNVASTRLVLGNCYAEEVIGAFGHITAAAADDSGEQQLKTALGIGSPVPSKAAASQAS